MERVHAHRRPSAGWPVILVLAVAVAVLVMAPAALAGPKSLIFDWLATPSWTGTLSGGATADESANGVIALPGDSCLVAGTLVGPAGDADISLTKYRGSTKLWTKLWAGPFGADVGGKAALSPDGKAVYIVGSFVTPSAQGRLVLLKRKVSNGRLLWAKTYRTPDHVVPGAIAVDAAGNVTAGATLIVATSVHCLVVRWTAEGVRKWAWRDTDPTHAGSVAMDLLPGPKGSAYVIGVSLSAAHEACLVARVSATGRTVWRDDYTGPVGLNAAVLAGALRPGGGFYAAGAAQTATNTAGLVLRYTATGRRSQFVLDGGPAGSYRTYRDVAVASTKAVVTVGRSDATGGNGDCYVTTWTPSGGAIGSVALPGAFTGDELDFCAVDALGGFYATGTLYTAANDPKILTLRGSVSFGGGGFTSLWGPVVSPLNSPRDIAVYDTTAYVVGQYESGAPTGVDQFLLAYKY